MRSPIPFEWSRAATGSTFKSINVISIYYILNGWKEWNLQHSIHAEEIGLNVFINPISFSCTHTTMKFFILMKIPLQLKRLRKKLQQCGTNAAENVWISSWLCCLPNSTTTCVVIKHSLAVLPQHIAGTIRYFVDDAFQLNGAAYFIKLLRGRNASVVVYYDVWHWKQNKTALFHLNYNDSWIILRQTKGQTKSKQKSFCLRIKRICLCVIFLFIWVWWHFSWNSFSAWSMITYCCFHEMLIYGIIWTKLDQKRKICLKWFRWNNSWIKSIELRTKFPGKFYPFKRNGANELSSIEWSIFAKRDS